MTDQELLEFKLEIKRRGTTIKQFALDNGFVPYMFTPAINRSMKIRDEYVVAINKFMEGEKK